MVRETGVNPKSTYTKDSKMVLYAALLNTQHYKDQGWSTAIQGMEWFPLLRLGVEAIEKGALGLPSTNVARERPSSLKRFRMDFLDSFRQNLSPHPHCQGILQSTSSQIWNFRPSSSENLLAQSRKILPPNEQWRKIFLLSFARHCDWGLIVVMIYYFQIWNKQEHIIIISKVISSHMGLMYSETPHIRKDINSNILRNLVLLELMRVTYWDTLC